MMGISLYQRHGSILTPTRELEGNQGSRSASSAGLLLLLDRTQAVTERQSNREKCTDSRSRSRVLAIACYPFHKL